MLSRSFKVYNLLQNETVQIQLTFAPLHAYETDLETSFLLHPSSSMRIGPFFLHGDIFTQYRTIEKLKIIFLRDGHVLYNGLYNHLLHHSVIRINRDYSIQFTTAMHPQTG